jgi:hypothetical protein
MKINSLNHEQSLKQSVKFQTARVQFEQLLFELQNRDLPNGVVISINKFIDEINSISISDENKQKVILIKKIQNKIIKLILKEGNLVPKNYYRNLWSNLGGVGFGIPIGLAIAACFRKTAFIGIGLPIGIAIGITIGSGKDKKALAEGRQLEFEV